MLQHRNSLNPFTQEFYEEITKMNVGEETICYQHQQAQDILEELLKHPTFKYTSYGKNIKETIEWITKANDSAVRMEKKLKHYKELIKKYEND